eukprot:1169023_1
MMLQRFTCLLMMLSSIGCTSTSLASNARANFIVERSVYCLSELPIIQEISLSYCYAMGHLSEIAPQIATMWMENRGKCLGQLFGEYSFSMSGSALWVSEVDTSLAGFREFLKNPQLYHADVISQQLQELVSRCISEYEKLLREAVEIRLKPKVVPGWIREESQKYSVNIPEDITGLIAHFTTLDDDLDWEANYESMQKLSFLGSYLDHPHNIFNYMQANGL